VTTAHLAVGALCWAAGVLAALTAGRCRAEARPGPLPEAGFVDARARGGRVAELTT